MSKYPKTSKTWFIYNKNMKEKPQICFIAFEIIKKHSSYLHVIFLGFLMNSSEKYIYPIENEPDWIIYHIITLTKFFINSYIKMSNRNNLPNHNGNDSVQSSDGEWEVCDRSFRISLLSQLFSTIVFLL
jgi:hypothetical protein